ncbi:MAG: class I SAM-dependent methyltransferase [Armatimonadetes bacterium]|nr:class I SAM-dependent methyltransferase [Armatimonadota bacterium]
MNRPKCLLCRSEDSGPFLAVQDRNPGKGFQILKCADCGFVYLPLPSEMEEGLSDGQGACPPYPKEYWWTESKGSFFPMLEKIYRDFLLFTEVRDILALVPEGKVLDVGCGKGDILKLLKKKGLEAHGLDSAGEAAGCARNVPGLHVAQGDLVGSEYETGCFDGITFFHVLEHITDPAGTLREAHRVLRDRGILVVQVPNIDSVQSGVFGRNWYGLQVPYHVSHFSPRTLTNLLDQTEFEIIRMKHFSLRCNSMILVSSLFPCLNPQALLERSSRGKNPVLLKLTCLALTLLFQPFALLESTLGRGAVITALARKRSRRGKK